MPTLFDNETGPASESVPVYSDAFSCAGPGAPVTVSSARLNYTETIEVVQHMEELGLSDDTDAYVPYRQGGQVALSYNNTGFIIFAQGTFRLKLTKTPTQGIYANYKVYGS